MLEVITLILFMVLALSIYHDARSLINPVLLIIFLFFAYITAVSFFYRQGYTTAYLIFVLGFLLVPAFLFFSGLFLIYNGFILLKREGRSKTNFLSLFLGIAILGFFLFVYLGSSFLKNLSQNSLLYFLYFLLIFTFLLFGMSFVAFMLYSILYLIIPKNKHYDFIIIHGAGLRNGKEVTPLLQKRIDKALEVFRKSSNPKAKLIASGGQGPDEKISEARAIAAYIRQQGDIPSNKVLLEEKSRSTYQNLLFSKELAEKEMSHPRFLFVTNAYHVFRTSVYAHGLHMSGDGLGCSTAAYYIPSAFIREFAAIVVRLKWVFIAIYAVFIGLLIISCLR
ncbi:YdcF family protein [Streptococcus devriesei]|uniref:YdcF family protein n=1 Tax=Streptococcus devriesei TaxID=231233 RepID=UPI000427E007|nr:YdcF family protein [Streptococcus devriesei]